MRPSHVFPRVFGRDLPRIQRGQGAVLWDVDGRRYIDGAGGAVVVNVGHGRREIVDAMAAQAGSVAYVHGTQFTSDALEAYASRLAAHAPGDCNRLYLVSGGSEANETALKLARAYHVARGEPSRTKALRRSVSYHGNTIATLSLSGRPALRAPYEPMLSPTVAVPAPFCYHCPLGKAYPDCACACVDDLDAAIQREGASTVAAYFAEPVIGASAGAAVPPEEYARRAREICDRHGVLYVDDEVMTGFGRTGRFFACEWSGIVPDILTCGKGMAGGYAPVGGVLVRGALLETLRNGPGFVHGFTFSHNPVTAAACLATLDVLERERLVDRSERLGAFAMQRFRGLASRACVGDVRGRGLLLGVEIVEDKGARRAFPRELRVAEAIARAAFERGLVLYSSTGVADGTNGDVLMFAPPFVISEGEIDESVAILGGALDDWNASRRDASAFG